MGTRDRHRHGAERALPQAGRAAGGDGRPAEGRSPSPRLLHQRHGAGPARRHDARSDAAAQDDLAGRVVRVLHDHSFIDDPTRIFRAIRLAARLGFTIEAHTAELMRGAIEAGALSAISKERIWRELFLAMDEAEAPAHPGRSLLARSPARPVRRTPVRRSVAAPPGHPGAAGAERPDLDRYVLYTGALLRGDASPIDFEGSGFSQRTGPHGRGDRQRSSPASKRRSAPRVESATASASTAQSPPRC